MFEVRNQILAYASIYEVVIENVLTTYYFDTIEVDLPSELIEIYSYRNGIHIIAERRKGISYELDLSKRAYRRMRHHL